MKNIGIIGLGYVGLPLAVEFGKLTRVIGYDINPSRVRELEAGIDRTQECSAKELEMAKHLTFTNNQNDLKGCDFYIITVPTPIDENKNPDLSAIRSASETVSSVMSAGAYIIYESTVYPGVTVDFCVPILEEFSGLKFNQDFFVGYSPERINPGDKDKRLKDIVKVTSGSTPEAANVIDDLYKKIITAGTWRASSISIAETAKVIENTQRDVNIALINELSLIFERLGIDTYEVLEAAATKWNFLNFKPGFVGGHCIGVDPYYLTYKAQAVNYHPEIILAGRRINDEMAKLSAKRLLKYYMKSGQFDNNKVLVAGFAFKENCPDIRNTKVVDFIAELVEFGFDIDIWDPLVDPSDVQEKYGLKIIKEPKQKYYSIVALVVPHDQIVKKGIDGIKSFGRARHIFFDLKGYFEKNMSDLRL